MDLVSGSCLSLRLCHRKLHQSKHEQVGMLAARSWRRPGASGMRPHDFDLVQLIKMIDWAKSGKSSGDSQHGDPSLLHKMWNQSLFLLQCGLSLCQVVPYMLFFMFSGLRWESSGCCCLTERRKRTESTWRTTSDHHSHWKAEKCGPLLSSLFAYCDQPFFKTLF